MLLDGIVADDTVFMQGKYISMAVGDTGTLGTRTAAPKGFNSYGKGEVTNLGMYVDLDGFGTGKVSTLQDAVAMGAIIERFNIGYSVNGIRHVEGNTQFGTSTILNSASKDLSDASAARAGWTGTTADKLKVDQVMTLTDDAKYVKVEITLTNQSSAAMSDLRYMRSIDPDQDTSYKNLIKVVEQGGDGKDGALIAAYQPNGNNPFFYYTADDRAKVSTYNMINRDPYKDLAYDKAQGEGYSVTADQAININFALGTLGAGASTKVVFYMGLTDNLSATISEIKSDGGTTPPVIDLSPIAVADSASTVGTKAATGNVLANDRDPEGSALTAKLVNGPANGTLKLSADGSFIYTAKAGFFGNDSFVYAASDGNSSSNATVSLKVTAPAPSAEADQVSTVTGASVSGNVLINDVSGTGAALTSKLVAGTAHGTLSLAADGSFTYAADRGYVGSDSFTYSASDGVGSASATVSIDVAAPMVVAPPPPVVITTTVPTMTALDKLLVAHDAVDGSAATNDVLNGSDGANAFYFDTEAKTGNDVVNLQSNDVLILSHALQDNNGDGIITFNSGKLRIDGTSKGDILTLADLKSLRYMGEAQDGAHVYANGAVKPKGVLESVLGGDHMTGDAADKKTQKFFFDTALGFDLGYDTIANMGKKDIVVTTTALNIANGDRLARAGADGQFDLVGTHQTIGEAGHVAITGTNGVAITALEFDGRVSHNGVDYYVYSLEGSTAGTATLTF